MPSIKFSHDEVRLRYTHLPFVPPAGYRRKVEDYWGRATKGGRFFNGPVLAALACAAEEAYPVIDLALTDYAHYLYAAQDPSHEFACRAVFAAAVILTSDGFLLLGQMADHTSVPGQIQFPGGGVELGADRKPDARICCQREVAEELGPAFTQRPAAFQPLCFKSGGDLSTVGIFYAVCLDISAEQAVRLFSEYQLSQRANGELPEFERLHAIKFDAQDIRLFLQGNEAPRVDYLEPLLVDHWEALSSALFALKLRTHSSDCMPGRHP